jgi:hypothetical protein
LIFASKAVKENYYSGTISMDFTLGNVILALVPFVGLFGNFTENHTEIHTHVTNKITRYPAVVKRMVQFSDGIYHVNENLAFDPQSGEAVMTETYDGYSPLKLSDSKYDGNYTSYNFLASAEYEDMGQKAFNERKIIKGFSCVGSGSSILKISKKYLSSANKHILSLPTCINTDQRCSFNQLLTEGSLVLIQRSDNTPEGIYHIGRDMTLAGNEIRTG